MRKYLLTISLVFFAFIFQSDNPMGWFVQPTPVNDIINSISFVDSLRGWAVTEGRTSTNDTAYILYTSNGGMNWSVQFNDVLDLKCIQFLDVNTGYAGGGSGSGTLYIYKTTNGGSNWNRIVGSFGTGGKAVDITFKDFNTGWYCDDNSLDGGVFKTTNGGLNWIRQLEQTYLPKKLFFLNQDTGWVNSNNSKLYRTINGGANWFLQSTFSYINGVQFLNKDTGYAIAGNTRFMKSINGGTNWISLDNPSAGPYALCLSFINSKTGWFGGAVNNIYKTMDGQTIKVQQSPTFRINSIQAIDTSVIFGGGTAIVKTTDGGGPVVSIINNSSEIISYYKLYQNYPNPFNPLTRINYELKITNYVTLKVYDLQGKEIAVLVNERKNAGSYSVEFDADRYNLSSGIYFYTLQTESFKETRKMILMK